MLDLRDEPAQFALFGISCHLKDYRLSYHLNQSLELSLVKMEDFRGFSFYHCRDEDRFNSYNLLGNRGQESILLPDLRQTDFLMLVEGPFRKTQKDHFLGRARGIQHELTAFEVRPETIRNQAQLLNDLELHLMNIRKETRIRYSPVKKQEETSCLKI